ncbi:hypothetical protein ZWY2020_030141 [Hordeum vulgare]|nr:hypothetical protein ZWY2020_030141 [Hordeum vulgare]
MRCRDRCLLRLGPAVQRLRSPPAPWSGQIEQIPPLAAAAPTKPTFDHPPRLLSRAFERAGRIAPPAWRRRPFPPACSLVAGPMPSWIAIAVQAPLGPRPMGCWPMSLLQGAANDLTPSRPPLYRDARRRAHTEKKKRRRGPLFFDLEPSSATSEREESPRGRGHISILPMPAGQPDPGATPISNRTQSSLPGRFASPPLTLQRRRPCVATG